MNECFSEKASVSESWLISQHLTILECSSEKTSVSQSGLIAKHLTTFECFSETASMSKQWLITKHLTTLECFFWNSLNVETMVDYKTSDNTWMFCLKQPQCRNNGWLQNIWQHLNVFSETASMSKPWLITKHLTTLECFLLKQPQCRNHGWLQNIWQHLNVFFWNSFTTNPIACCWASRQAIFWNNWAIERACNTVFNFGCSKRLW